MTSTLEPAQPTDTMPIVALRNAAAAALTSQHGQGPWSTPIAEGDVQRSLKQGQVWVRKLAGEVVATLAISAKKPWSIDTKNFPRRRMPLYLTAMAVAPQRQRSGLGRSCIEALPEVIAAGCDAIWLDAYDHPAGAGDFYRRCGFIDCGVTEYRGAALRYFELVL